MAGRRTFFFEGLGVSDGVAIGPAYVIESESSPTESYELSTVEIDGEVDRFLASVRLAKEEVRSIGQQVAERIDRQQAAIFDAHLMMLEDPQIVERTVEQIRARRMNAESVLWNVTQELGDQMKGIGDQYFAERNHDLYDVSRRVIKFLRRSGSEDQPEPPRDTCIVVANELGPAETAQFSRDHVLGFCTNEGGATGHAAIVSKALGIPAVVGLEFITHYVRTGDMLILDGNEGKIILNPTEEQIAFYRQRAEQIANFRMALGELRDIPAETTDNVRIKLYANIELPTELQRALDQGAEGIGLFRTEFLYLDRQAFPSEDDQFESYRRVLDGMGDRPVIIRTIDIGGDKLPDRETAMLEMNPFMGMRAIRLCLRRPELFTTQLRAMMRAGAGRSLSILVPMISGIEEMRQARRFVREVRDDLDREGCELPKAIHVGAMVEIPSAAIQVEALCKEADFLSIGTNDLVQYTLAVDRINKSVATLYREAHPAVLSLIELVSRVGLEKGVPVSVCGEMASDPRFAVVLVGMGIRTLSMASNSLASVKSMLRSISIAECESLARDVLRCMTPTDVEDLLERRLRDRMAKYQFPSS